MNLSVEIPATPVPPGATQPIPPKSTTVKTDKPRPHVCATCTRSFARLEHLKRHERSHTKEKPFKCDVCERCFARRDLLLRHRQKLHASFPESPRVRQTKRKTKKTTASAAANAAVMSAHQTAQAVGPSVSTPLSLSTTMGGLDMALDSPSSTGTGASPPAMNPKVLRRVQKQTNNNSSRPRTMSFSASSSTSYTTHKDIEAWNTNSQWHPAAPPQVGFSTPQLVPASLSDSETNPFEDFFQASDPLFINPQLLGQGHSPDGQLKQFQHQMLEFESNWSGRDMLGIDSDEVHHNGQSWKKEMPPANSNGAGLNMHVNENALNIRSQQQHQLQQDTMNNMLSPPTTINSGSEGSESNELRSVLGFGLESHNGTNGRNMDVLQPLDHQYPGFHASHLQSQTHNGHLLHQMDQQHPEQGPENLWDVQQQQQQQQNGHHLNNHQQQQQQQQQHGAKNAVAVPGSSSHVITPQLRLHVLTTLSSPTPFSSNPPPHLPSTLDLQRHVNSYIENFGKHMPFLHETLEFTAENMPLALGMAAVGALYTYEHANSQAIFEISRCCIHVYLENRRERRDPDNYTPLWLIQSLVLGVVYGLFNGESMANEIAVAQASAVVSLAKSAGLQMPVTTPDESDSHTSIEDKWHRFVEVQSRTRTMHVIHNICSMLATSYGVTPMLSNDDLKCGCPCDESLWGATTASSWWEILQQKGMAVKDAMQGKNFGQLFSRLLSGQSLVEYKVPQFTLLSLIYGLHLEIHIQKSQNDDEYQHSSELDREKNWIDHRRPALDTAIIGWETAWTMSPLSTLGANSRYGPIMSDSIPLSQLAHLRAYTDLRRVKESFWKRDFEGMGHALDQLLCPSLQDGNPFDSLFESASYAADAISLWSRNSENWSLQTLVSQTFIHSILSLFDCGLVLSEFLNRLEKRETWTSEESQLISRIRKIFYRVADLVGEDGMNGNSNNDARHMANESGILDIEHSDSTRLSVLTLEYVSKVLCKSYVWPFALVMGEALRFRAAQLGH